MEETITKETNKEERHSSVKRTNTKKKKKGDLNKDFIFELSASSNSRDKIRGLDIFEPLDEIDESEEDSIQKINISENFEKRINKLQINLNNLQNKIDTHNDYPYFRVQNTNKYIPQLQNETSILSTKQIRELHAFLPYFNQYKDLKLIYSSKVDGTALRTFYEKSYYINNSILVLKDDSQNIFGAYVSEAIQIKYNKFYGDGETFLFSFFKSNKINYFPCVPGNDQIIFSDDKRLAFGCSGNNFSLCLENDFLNGYTGYTDTFQNLPLSSNAQFMPINIELWTFI